MNQKQLTKADFEVTSADFLFKDPKDLPNYKVKNIKDLSFLEEGRIYNNELSSYLYKSTVPFGYYFIAFFKQIILIPMGFEIEILKLLAKKFNFAKKRIEHLKPILYDRYYDSFKLFIIGFEKSGTIDAEEKKIRLKKLDKFMEYFMWDSFEK